MTKIAIIGAGCNHSSHEHIRKVLESVETNNDIIIVDDRPKADGLAITLIDDVVNVPHYQPNDKPYGKNFRKRFRK